MRGTQYLLPALAALGLAVAPAGAVDQNDVDRAIARGVANLKANQGRDGVWTHNEMGMTALAGLALLECKVPADDKAVVAAARAIRQGALSADQTYTVSLCLVFLDRLGDPRDVPLIESLGVRLLAGQTADGGWGYRCPPISEAEARRLMAATREGVPKPEDPKRKRGLRDLPREIQQQVAAVQRLGPGLGADVPGGVVWSSDNSNTQFATLALWVARRHGLPVDAALARLDAHYRRSQSTDGGWGYTGGAVMGNTSTPAMTCAGIMGLAVAHGAAHDPDRKGARLDPAKDVSLKAALTALGTCIGDPVGRAGQIPQIGVANGGSYYFLWSLERAAVALGLETIGKKDWYAWGAEVLIANQAGDGSWTGSYSGADTCFALLFLARSNLVGDLTANLKGKLRDPGTVELRAGIGTTGLRGLRPGLGPQPRQNDPRPKDRKENLKPIPSQVENTTADRLSTALVDARGAEQERVLNDLREKKGTDYTEALALAIPQLDAEVRRKAREALAERLTRMTARILRGYLQDPDAEIRRAAVLASAMKDLRDHIPLLIERLDDGEPLVVRAAVAALKAMTNQDFGPASGATAEEHKKAVAAWKDWWSRQGDK